METTLLPQPAECIILNSRMFNYEISTVYKAWTAPQWLALWWGPEGFTNTFNEYDLRVGGKWDFVMHSPDGKDFKNLSEFILIEPGKRLVWNHITPPVFQIDVTFTETEKAQTLVTFKMVFETPEAAGNLRDFCLEKNEENFDRLETVLKKMTNN